MSRLELTPDPQAEADRRRTALAAAVTADLDALARLLAATADGDLLGPTAFQVRDLVHRIGAQAIETALAERKKTRVANLACRPVPPTSGGK